MNYNLLAKIKSIQNDWGGEFRFLHFILANHGIIYRLSCPHTHQQNKTADHKHRRIVKKGLALMANASLPQFFWMDAFKQPHISSIDSSPLQFSIFLLMKFFFSVPLTTPFLMSLAVNVGQIFSHTFNTRWIFAPPLPLPWL